MLEFSRKQTALYTRAKHQLREIELGCHQVTIFARQLNNLPAVMASQINCHKIERLKGNIRDKLKEYASNIDAIHQLLDRKIQAILAEIKQMEARSSAHKCCKKCLRVTTDFSKSHKDEEFSQTLNPTILRLQSKIREYQAKETKLRGRIRQLETENATLIEEYRVYSSSNNKLCQIKMRQSQENPESEAFSRSLSKKIISPQTCLQFSSSKRKLNLIHASSEQASYETSYSSKSKSRLRSCGGIFSSPKSIASLRRSSKDDEEKIDGNRRFELLLDKLRDSQQQHEITEGSGKTAIRRNDLFAYMPVQRHHI